MDGDDAAEAPRERALRMLSPIVIDTAPIANLRPKGHDTADGGANGIRRDTAKAHSTAITVCGVNSGCHDGTCC